MAEASSCALCSYALRSMQAAVKDLCTWPDLKLREAVSLYFTMVAVFLVILVAALQGTSPKESPFPYTVPLDPQGQLQLSWNVSYPEEAVYFQILARDLRFGLLFGMSDRGDFEDADLAVLWSDGLNSYFGDAWSDQKGQLHLDSQQDYQLLEAHKKEDGLYLIFKRAFSTCDPQDYLIETLSKYEEERRLMTPRPIRSEDGRDVRGWRGGKAEARTKRGVAAGRLLVGLISCGKNKRY
ncbi:hypothetical protein NDU88_012237 [Pleurodeles waltl]|uniref:DOMON domain-containing protein n=1 Tax=Pleurodeles waltl TaxID=8319 RepID=A0AAV7R428_PLEWA|nr:hypothetical protein NDU88_012237 [Pleurodeles waltl]